MKIFLTTLCAATVCLAGTALAQTATSSHTDQVTTGAGTEMSPEVTGFHPEMMATMEKMDKAMKAHTMTGNPDRDFATMMIPHHQGAIDMARVQLKFGKNEKLRKMAEKLIAEQEKEIKELQAELQAMETREPTTTETPNQ